MSYNYLERFFFTNHDLHINQHEIYLHNLYFMYMKNTFILVVKLVSFYSPHQIRKILEFVATRFDKDISIEFRYSDGLSLYDQNLDLLHSEQSYRETNESSTQDRRDNPYVY